MSLRFFLKHCYDIVYLLFWVLWTGLAASNKNNSMNLLENVMFICIQKNQLDPFFLSWDITPQKTILNKNIIFHFRLFPRKITTSLFKKCKTIFGPFSPFLGKTEFSPKLCSYKLLFLILIKYQCAKLKKKLLIGFQTPVSAGRTDAQTDKHELHEKWIIR